MVWGRIRLLPPEIALDESVGSRLDEQWPAAAMEGRKKESWHAVMRKWSGPCTFRSSLWMETDWSRTLCFLVCNLDPLCSNYISSLYKFLQRLIMDLNVFIQFFSHFNSPTALRSLYWALLCIEITVYDRPSDESWLRHVLSSQYTTVRGVSPQLISSRRHISLRYQRARDTTVCPLGATILCGINFLLTSSFSKWRPHHRSGCTASCLPRRISLLQTYISLSCSATGVLSHRNL